MAKKKPVSLVDLIVSGSKTVIRGIVQGSGNAGRAEERKRQDQKKRNCGETPAC